MDYISAITFQNQIIRKSVYTAEHDGASETKLVIIPEWPAESSIIKVRVAFSGVFNANFKLKVLKSNQQLDLGVGADWDFNDTVNAGYVEIDLNNRYIEDETRCGFLFIMIEGADFTVASRTKITVEGRQAGVARKNDAEKANPFRIDQFARIIRGDNDTEEGVFKDFTNALRGNLSPNRLGGKEDNRVYEMFTTEFDHLYIGASEVFDKVAFFMPESWEKPDRLYDLEAEIWTRIWDEEDEIWVEGWTDITAQSTNYMSDQLGHGISHCGLVSFPVDNWWKTIYIQDEALYQQHSNISAEDGSTQVPMFLPPLKPLYWIRFNIPSLAAQDTVGFTRIAIID